MSFQRKPPSLIDLCIRTTIDNLRYLGDVGETDIYLLKDILPHCTVDQLTHIEESTKGRDLSSVTDNLWKRFYQQQFGVDSFNVVIKRMKEKGVKFKWRQLYDAKMKEREKAQKESVDRLKKLYAAEESKKQSRQIKICSKIPPSSKRSFFGGSGSSFPNLKGNLMKKAKLESIKSPEARIQADMRKRDLRRQISSPHMIPRPAKPNGFLGKGTPSSSGLIKPFDRRS
ncbi:hypothetical protein QJS04_geneDACA000630 [Acorus gramineus]|uniref:Elongin-A n=1 Tax=Acorus gramineus TaxID=55184 RepID=A0AAV9AUK3_ACOGR|nr:hypothetical protein QJS04_geneDACA000630 [Acorus gramineus]